MFVILLVLNIVLAIAFILSGGMKVVRPTAALKTTGMVWVDDFTPASVKLIGAAEVIGGIGLILPFTTNIAAVLSPIAAVALAIIMIGAVVVHVRRSEAFIPALVLAVLSIVSAVFGFLYLAR
ncbi:MAG: DoxX family rane protein [Subtercola sp.]|nr:DoxX family rane protein [Subtercola sp.]